MRLAIPKTALLLYCILIMMVGCVKPYEPPEVVAATSLLVVDGQIQAGNGATTTIKLSRTRRLNDTAATAPETGARVFVESEDQSRYQLQEGPVGTYTAHLLPLQLSVKYRIYIEVANGERAASDFVSIKETPSIDKLDWEEKEGIITIYLDTNDPQNNTRYYRWEYDETWEYDAYYQSLLGFENGVLFFRDLNDLRNKCWITKPGSNILLGASTSLTQDVISRKPLSNIKAASEKTGIRYSILVRQYALSKEAFQYWQILQKNTEQRGSLFDAQPSQLQGNIHNLNNPEEPVVGYISGSTVQQQRLFIRREDIIDKYNPEPRCGVKIVNPDSAVYYLNMFNLKPAYYVTGEGLAITTAECVDCTLQGGTNKKPLFW